MTAADLRMELRRSRSLTAWLAALLAGYGVIMAFMYPIMVDNDELFRQYMQTFPDEFLVAFGMTGSLGDPGVFFTTYVSSWLWPIMAAIAAILGGTRVAADLDRGFLDLPLATPLSRTRHLVLSILGQALVIAILAAATVGSRSIRSLPNTAVSSLTTVGTRFIAGEPMKPATNRLEGCR